MSPASGPGFTVLINGGAYGGWTSIEVTKSLDTMAGGFDIGTTERWPGQPADWPVQTGDAVQIMESGELLLTGWVDVVGPREDASSHEIRVSGRGRTNDLVDCSAMNMPGRWANQKIEAIIGDLTSPFGISVATSGDTGAPFAAFALQQGEAVKDAIDRLCQQRGLLPVETTSGDLMLTAPGTDRAGGQLVLGGPGANLIAGEGKHDASARFSLYVVKGQRQGNDQDSGATVSKVTASAVDPLVTRYRPLMIISEEQADTGSAANRAKFAATVRAGRSQSGKLTRTGSRDAAGALWAANRLITVNAPDLGLQGDLLISEVRFAAGDSGTTTEISVTRPEAYSLGEVKGVGLSRLDSRHAGRGMKAKS
jgi:prophage tail gpP-like protein